MGYVIRAFDLRVTDEPLEFEMPGPAQFLDVLDENGSLVLYMLVPDAPEAESNTERFVLVIGTGPLPAGPMSHVASVYPSVHRVAFERFAKNPGGSMDAQAIHVFYVQPRALSRVAPPSGL